ncbi:hypothetical protein Moror_2075 [Moniliophthora roreri MCA 2997]|uniref:Uncharacterized protein n=2 Tax=Moniliophthora roreri TaxID=221103 RepID=V2WQA9_MONRO|nr:hypothetical protein Moror_2075 [Moniliophthora roreri MCA 2997]KAI3621545.1 hypothetical protein WG66_017044 [Moniliophthora roreri]
MNTFRPLSVKQERRLVEYLEDEFIKLTRAYKKRVEPDSNVATLPSYLEITQKLLSMILQIPPFDPSTPLRTTFLLRLTNDVLNAIPGYTPNTQDLPTLLDWLDDLDQAWLVVLRLQVWDPKEGAGVTVEIPGDSNVRSSPMSQTERTRLKSLLLSGMEMLEGWMECLDDRTADADEEESGMEDMLERLDVREGFNEVFSRTFRELGESMVVDTDPNLNIFRGEIAMSCG